jgi:hypothetical protein
MMAAPSIEQLVGRVALILPAVFFSVHYLRKTAISRTPFDSSGRTENPPRSEKNIDTLPEYPFALSSSKPVLSSDEGRPSAARAGTRR